MGMIFSCNLLSVDDEYGAKGIGRRVRAYRRAAGLTAEQLAERVDGLTGNAVAKLENGHRREVSTELLVELAWALRVPPLVLLFPLEDESATLQISGDQLSMLTLGPWLQGLPVVDPDLPRATALGNGVNGQFRQLIINAEALNQDLITRLIEEGALSAADASSIQAAGADRSDAIQVGRAGLRMLRDALGLDDG